MLQIEKNKCGKPAPAARENTARYDLTEQRELVIRSPLKCIKLKGQFSLELTAKFLERVNRRWTWDQWLLHPKFCSSKAQRPMIRVWIPNSGSSQGTDTQHCKFSVMAMFIQLLVLKSGIMWPWHFRPENKRVAELSPHKSRVEGLQ